MPRYVFCNWLRGREQNLLVRQARPGKYVARKQVADYGPVSELLSFAQPQLMATFVRISCPSSVGSFIRAPQTDGRQAVRD